MPALPLDAVPALVQDAIDAADFIRTNVAQTVQNERGNFEFKPTPDHVHVGTEPPPLPPEHVIMGRRLRAAARVSRISELCSL